MFKLSATQGRLRGWLRRHKLDAAIMAGLLAVIVPVSLINMDGYPQRFEDEGTYISQAWAVKERNTLAHYTYWYDHPPAGWIQIAAYLMVTDGLERYGLAITAGREFMLLLHIATIGLLFALARRLGIGRLAAGLGVLAYGLSPLVVEFSRYVLLDNVALPWLLAAFVLALNPRRSLAAAIGSALCMAVAILSKETFLALLPVLLYALWHHGDPRNRRYLLAAFGVVFVTVSGLYVLYAALKNELLPGEGHVSLLGTFYWQLFGREGSGSVLAADSGSRGLLQYWLNIDRWLLALGAIALPVALYVKSLRPAGLALLVGLLLMLRSGYLPYPYVIVLLPFAALTLAGALDQLVIRPAFRAPAALRAVAVAAGAGLLLGACFLVAPAWQSKLVTLMTANHDQPSRQAVNWVDDNISRDKRLVVESALWTDLQTAGFNQPDPVWLYKTETDPEVTQELGGWQGIDYIILNGPTVGSKDFADSFPTVHQVIRKSQLAAEFGSDNQKVLIYRVKHDDRP